MKHEMIFISLFFFFNFIYVSAQEPLFYSFNELYGFDKNIIYDLYHDEDKFWITTNDGLFKYSDGSFKNYYDPRFSTSYSNLQKDIEGRMWFQNFSGQLFYIDNDSLLLYHDYSSIMKSSFTYDISQFPLIYPIMDKLVLENKFGEKENKKKLELFYPIGGDKVIFTCSKIPDGDLVCYCMKDGIYIYIIDDGNKIQEKKIQLDKPFKGHNRRQGNSILSIIQHDGNIELYKLEKGELNKMVSFQMEGKGDLEIQNFSILDDVLYILTKSGIIQVDMESGIQKNNKWLNYNSVSKFERDAEKNLWVGTTNNGIFIAPNISVQPIKMTSLGLMYATMDNNGNIYAMDIDGSLKIINHNTAEVIRHETNASNYVRITYNPFKEQIISLCLGCYSYDIKNKRNISHKLTYYKDVVFFDEETFVAASSVSSSIYSYWKDKEQMPEWVQPFFNNIEKINYNGGWRMNLKYQRSSHVAFDKGTGLIYANRIGGVYNYHMDGVEKHENEVTFENKTIKATCLTEDDSLGVWMGAQDNCLLKIEYDSVVYRQQFDFKIEKIAQWGNVLFLLNGNDVVKFDTEKNEKEIINYLDGIPKEKIIDIFVYNDTLKIVSKKYMTQIPCNFTSLNTIKPQCNISKVEVNGETVLFEENNKLKSHENDISILLSAVSFRSQKNYTYQYRMKGVSDKWIRTGSDNNLVGYPNMHPGEYQFEAQVCNEDDICSQIKSFSFLIKKPIYKEGWFWMALFSILMLLIGNSIWRRIKNERLKSMLLHEKESLQKELYKSKIAAFRTQMNPHFIFNALNSIQDYIISNDRAKASDYLSDFADLIRSYLSQSKENEISLRNEIATLSLYLKLEKARFKESFTYEISYAPSLDVERIHIPVMLAQPFVENSIKHGLLHKKGEKILHVKFTKENQYLKCAIEDNGIGVQKSLAMKRKSNYQSFSTSAIKERIKLANANKENKIKITTIDLYDLEKNPSGTRVEIFFPLSDVITEKN